MHRGLQTSPGALDEKAIQLYNQKLGYANGHLLFCRNFKTFNIMSLVLSYTEAKKVFEHAKANQYALPAVNVTSSPTINASLEAAKEAKSPIIIQLRSEERRVGKECISTYRSRWSPNH